MTVGAAVVGLGGMGNTHLRGLLRNRNVDVVAVCDTDPDKLRGELLGGKVDSHTGEFGIVDTGGIRRYSDFSELLCDDRVDMVCLCVPTDLHAKMTCQALQARKHVFCGVACRVAHHRAK